MFQNNGGEKPGPCAHPSLRRQDCAGGLGAREANGGDDLQRRHHLPPLRQGQVQQHAPLQQRAPLQQHVPLQQYAPLVLMNNRLTKLNKETD